MNKLYGKCIEECKQSKEVEIIICPQRRLKRREKKEGGTDE
jgi:hypothetical protein